MVQKHIEIVRSGTSALSSMGLKSCNALLSVLKKHYAVVGVSTVHSIADLETLVARQPDLVFIGMKYLIDPISGDKVWISAYLEEHSITHTGSPQEAIALEQEKPLAKQCARNAGVQTSPYLVVKKGDVADLTLTPMRFPLFVKPTGLGGGTGIDSDSIVQTPAALHAKIESLAANHGADALIEEYLSGREFSVAVLKDIDSDDLMAMPLELNPSADARGNRILSHELKSAPLETPTLPVTDTKLRSLLTKMATDAFIALGARDYGRIDIRLDASGVPHFLEANLIPCIIEGSGNFPKACMMNLDMDYETMILRIINLAFSRTLPPIGLEQENDDFIPRGSWTVLSPT